LFFATIPTKRYALEATCIHVICSGRSRKADQRVAPRSASPGRANTERHSESLGEVVARSCSGRAAVGARGAARKTGTGASFAGVP
jgi:hypothetical protein